MKNLSLTFGIFFASAIATAAPHAANGPAEKQNAEKVESTEQGGDTYNFYFQKSPGANDVTQGKEQSVKPAETQAEAEVRTSVPSPSLKDDSKVELSTGLVLIPSLGGSGLEVGGQFNATPSFGIQVNLMMFRYQPDGSSTHTFSAQGSFDTETVGEATGGSVAVAYAPFQLRKKVKIQGLLGAMVLNDTRKITTNTFSARGMHDEEKSEQKTHALGFVGVGASAYLSKAFGLGGYGKLTTDPKFSQVGLSLLWHF